MFRFNRNPPYIKQIFLFLSLVFSLFFVSLISLTSQPAFTQTTCNPSSEDIASSHTSCLQRAQSLRNAALSGCQGRSVSNGDQYWCKQEAERAYQQNIQKCDLDTQSLRESQYCDTPLDGNAINMGNLESDIDRPGLDYANFDLDTPDPTSCLKACANDPKCKAWTYVKPDAGQGPNPRCWLKYAAPSPRPHSCCVSGIKLE